MSSFLAALRDRVLVLDGGFGTWMQAHDLGPDDFGGPDLEGCNENLVATRPDLIAALHDAYLSTGCDAVETATFGAFGLVLNEYDIADRAYDLNLAAARIAKEVATAHSTPDRPRWVVGSIGPGTRLPSLGAITFRALRDDYEVQARGLLDGGSDVLLIETVYDLLQAKSAMIACSITETCSALSASRTRAVSGSCGPNSSCVSRNIRWKSSSGRPSISRITSSGYGSAISRTKSH